MESPASANMLVSTKRPALPPLWVILFVASAILFLGGSGSFWLLGARYAALAGVAGALASVLVILVFSGRNGRRRN